MNKKGFTLVELIAVLTIIAILMVIVVPAYNLVYDSILKSRLRDKYNEIEVAALEYAESIVNGTPVKDSIKDVSLSSFPCTETSIATLIENGYMKSDSSKDAVLYSPIDSDPLTGSVYLCYCSTKFDVKAYYAEEFHRFKYFYDGDYVMYEGSMYQAIEDYEMGADFDTTIFRKVTDYCKG